MCVASGLGLGCQSGDELDSSGTEPLTGAETDALMFGSWAVERANVTFFNPDTGEAMTQPTDVFPDHAVPISFNPDEADVMLTFGGSFHFGEGASRWSRVYLTIVEDGEYIRNEEEEYAVNPPPFGDAYAGTSAEDWNVDDSFRLVAFQGPDHVEAMVDMDEDGESVWVDYDREAQEFNDGSCINSLHLTRVASN
jgi:hypothetical protein